MKLRLAGAGHVPYQLATRFWLPAGAGGAPATNQSLEIGTRLERVQLRPGEETGLEVRVRNRSARVIPMPLIDVALPPGVEIDEAKLLELAASRVVEKVQRIDQRALFYLEELRPGKELKLRVGLRGKSPLQVTLRPSTVYEYYRPENRAESGAQKLVVTR